MSDQDQNPNEAILEANQELLERFMMNYIADNGVEVQLVEAIARELFGQQVVVNGTVPEGVAATPREMLGEAIKDALVSGFLGDLDFSLEALVNGAVSFEFLVRWARKLDPKIMPPELIPSDELVEAALAIFHQEKQTIES